MRSFIAACVLAFITLPLHAAERLLVAAAANFKPAMEEIVAAFRAEHPDWLVEPVYASTGKLGAQIREGAPFDLFLSADMETPQALARDGLAATPVRAYARGRIVLWSATTDASTLKLSDLARMDFRRIAIANPRLAPYGARAAEALRATKIWDAVEPRLIYGENITQTAQFVHSGNAQVGIIALSQAVDPALARRGGHAPIDDALHAPLDQGFIITRRAADRPLAAAFAEFMLSTTARAIIERHGYVIPLPEPGAAE